LVSPFYKLGLEGIVEQAEGLDLSLRPLPGLAQDEEPGVRSGASGGGGGLGTMRNNPGAQYEISVDGVPRTHRDRQDIALQTARFLKSRNPNSMVKMKDSRTGEETVVAFKPGE
jgi:hypothetical protein